MIFTPVDPFLLVSTTVACHYWQSRCTTASLSSGASGLVPQKGPRRQTLHWEGTGTDILQYVLQHSALHYITLRLTFYHTTQDTQKARGKPVGKLLCDSDSHRNLRNPTRLENHYIRLIPPKVPSTQSYRHVFGPTSSRVTSYIPVNCPLFTSEFAPFSPRGVFVTPERKPIMKLDPFLCLPCLLEIRLKRCALCCETYC